MNNNSINFLPEFAEVEYLTARDGVRLRVGFFPSFGDAKASILLLNGHREFLEKYTEFIGSFQRRGFNVYSMDYRGQGLSDKPLDNHNKSHNPDFSLLVEDINEFISRKIKSDTFNHPFYMVAHSMGAQLGLRYLHDHPGIFTKAVLMSPFTDLNYGLKYVGGLAKIFFKTAALIGFSEAFAPGQVKNKDMVVHQYAIDQLTHDEQRYYSSVRATEHNPELFLGGVTFGWLKGAIDSMNIIKQSGYMKTIKTPILCLLAGEENVVDNVSTLKLLQHVKNVSIEIIENSRHEIYRETDQVISILFGKIDNFLL
ncbi:MAG: alpha/beta hydrolase [Kordiimonadaceae bacterium]|jgi:lysophospholipase|nr:alpha/beta hydrolase [Kordiimonadaceae bacterium]MBT6031401.1 alpha/beta hydrolase [Kordiimonadaceae bacterium]